jgi:TonB family protein
MGFLESTFIAERILNLSLNSLCILLLGLILTRLFHHRAAPLRSGIILMVILILLALPIIKVTSLVPRTPSLKAVLPVAMLDSSKQPGTIFSLSSPITTDSFFVPPSSLSFGKKTTKKINSIFSSLQSDNVFIKILNGLGLIWILGSLFLLIRLFYGVFSLNKLKKGLVEICDKRILLILKEAEGSFTDHPSTRIFISRNILSPLAVGFFKPIVILPYDLYNKLNDSEIRGILLHELSHIHHKDQITGILQRLVIALHWWNPLIYTLSADFSCAREEISDNHVLLENDKKIYAECLINLAERTSLISRLPVYTGMASPHFPLKDRVQNILSEERIMETKLKRSAILMIGLIALFVLGAVAGHRLTFSPAKSSTETGSMNEGIPESTIEIKNVETSANVEPLPIPQEKKEKTDKEKSAEKKITKPKLIKKVEPVYPKEAKEAGIEGAVILEAVTDIKGKVVDAKIIKGEHEILNNAALDAVKLWEYQPFIINGKPIGLEFTVTMRFSLEDESKSVSTDEATSERVDIDVISLPEDIELTLKKEVKPIYPKEALEKLIQGNVLLEAVIDEEGNVVDISVLEGEHEVLNNAAIEAVKQWKYESYKIKIAQKVRYKIKIQFHVR